MESVGAPATRREDAQGLLMATERTHLGPTAYEACHLREFREDAPAVKLIGELASIRTV